MYLGMEGGIDKRVGNCTERGGDRRGSYIIEESGHLISHLVK